MKNMQQMMKQAQQMQEQLQKQLEQTVVEASAGGEMVSVKMNGNKQLLSVEIDPEVLSGGDREMLQDLIVAAVNEASFPGYVPLLDVANVSDAVDKVRNVAFANASLAEIFALSKFGIAIAAKRAMIATTIMISTSVKPFLFILFISFLLTGSLAVGISIEPVKSMLRNE